jgi:hypothetical protein
VRPPRTHARSPPALLATGALLAGPLLAGSADATERCPAQAGFPALSAATGGGTGAPDDPYQLGSLGDLLTVADYYDAITSTPSDACWTAHLTQTADVTFGDDPWPSIGGGGVPFRGTYDGGGHALTGLTIAADPSTSGFFGATEGAVLRDLTLSGSDVTAEPNQYEVGALVGHAMRSTIEDVTFAGTVSASDTSRHVGGLLGRTTGSTVRSVAAQVIVTGGEAYVGGVIGHAEESDVRGVTGTLAVTAGATATTTRDVGGVTGYVEHGTLRDVDVTVNVSLGTGAAGNEVVGGVAGSVEGAVLRDVRASGTVDGPQDVGGIAGKLRKGAAILDTSFDGTLTSPMSGSNFGGIVGETRDGVRLVRTHARVVMTVWNEAGGLVGDAEDVFVEQVSATGTVTSPTRVGGLFGRASRVTLAQGYADVVITSVGIGSEFGGLAGEMNVSRFEDASAHGSVTGGTKVGGLVGEASDSRVHRAYATGTVQGTERVGGLFGDVVRTTVTASAAFGPSTATGAPASQIGGFAGRADQLRFDDVYAVGATDGQIEVGALVGRATKVRVERAFATGAVSTSDPTNVGGAFGSVDADVTSVGLVWDVDRTGRTEPPGSIAAFGTGVSTAALRDPAARAASGWAIASGARSDRASDVWGICPGASDPFLLWQVNDDGTFTPSTAPAPPCVGPVATPTPSLADEARLASLHAAAGTLTPAFAPERTRYALDLPGDVDAVLLTATTLDDAATVTVDGTGGGRGTASARVDADVEPRTVDVVVTAEDGATTRTYRVDVARTAATSDAPTDLRGLPDDAAAWVAFRGPDAPYDNLQIKVGGDPWRAFLPAATTSPVRIDGLTNGVPTTVRLRIERDGVPGAASAAVAVTPRAQTAATLTLDAATLGIDATTPTGDGGTRVTARAVVRHDGSEVLHDVWIAPSAAGADVVALALDGDATGRLERVGDAWYWADADLAPGATAPLLLTLEVR